MASASATDLGPVLRWGRAQVRSGTCSWTDPTLVRESDWYPRRSMSAAERLAFYAARFPLVEADSTYYWPPTPDLARGWAERTPPGFRMNVKAYSLLTHHPTRFESLWEDMRQDLPSETSEPRGRRQRRNVYAQHLPEEALDEAWSRFLHALGPLHEAGKLGAVLLQYPEWFVPNKQSRQELERARERLGNFPACVEFRSPRWLAGEQDRQRTLALLRQLFFAFVVVDAPSVSELPAVVAVSSTDLAVVRFHGRADERWKRPGLTAAERFRYLYRDDELQEWVPRIRELSEGAREVHVLMNNCYQDYGVRNAADISGLLVEAGARAE